MEVSARFSRKTIWILGLLAVNGVFSFLWFDQMFTTWRVAADLPGDVLALLEMFSFFGHGVGCLIAVMLIWNLDQRQRRGIPLVIGSTVLAGITTTLMKICILRPRPFLDSVEIASLDVTVDQAVFNNSLQSFPSGHTATAFAMAGALSIMYPQGKKMFCCLAILVGVQRVITQNHFPSDVFVGAMIGIVDANLVYFAIKQLRRKQDVDPTLVLIPSAPNNIQQCA